MDRVPSAQTKTEREGEASQEAWVKKVIGGINTILATPRMMEAGEEVTDDLQRCLGILQNKYVPLFFHWDTTMYQKAEQALNDNNRNPPSEMISGIDVFTEMTIEKLSDESEFDPNEEDSDGVTRPNIARNSVRLIRLEKPPFWQLARFLYYFCFS